MLYYVCLISICSYKLMLIKQAKTTSNIIKVYLFFKSGKFLNNLTIISLSHKTTIKQNQI